jgi:ABC-type polysaccharide/polyol phosphate export permease
VFFRDLQHLIVIAMQGLFFLTPVLYKHDALAGKVAWLVGLNPVVPFIELFRSPLYLATLPSANVVVRAAIISLSAIGIGLFVFLRHEKEIVFRL